MPKINRSGKNNSRTIGNDNSIEPFWQTTDGKTVRLYQGNCVEVLSRLPEKSVHCVVTSPPYWGLRDYGTGEWVGGDENCDHSPTTNLDRTDRELKNQVRNDDEGNYAHPSGWSGGGRKSLTNSNYICKKCGAKRIDQQLGSEKTPEEFVENMVAVFREVRRVLRDDGTCWLNLGDTYTGGGTTGGYSNKSTLAGYTNPNTKGRRMANQQSNAASVNSGLKPGNLVGIPWRVALALQADGWVLRQDIIWHKPSPMPESVRNRCTKAHEYIFLLTKSNRYFYDAEAIKENTKEPRDMDYQDRLDRLKTKEADFHKQSAVPKSGRNKRSVWTIASEAYSGAHFATFPRKLIEPCILAGTSEYGACSQCGAPWRRVLEEKTLTRERPNDYVKYAKERGIKSGLNKDRGDGGRSNVGGSSKGVNSCANTVAGVQTKTVGWEPTCDCGNTETAPCTVLDPFIGSGTSCVVSLENGRRSVGIDLSENYLEKNAVPRIEGALLSRPSLAPLAGKGPKRIDLGETIELE